MRPDTSFSDRKLTKEEFAEKYWMGGKKEYVYQYHTAGIEDGRDEREQFIFNNIRALYNLHCDDGAEIRKNQADIFALKGSAIRQTEIAMTLFGANVILIILTLIRILLLRRGS